MGQHLNGSPRDRSAKAGYTGAGEKLLSPLTKRDRILEIGPSFNPMVPKRDGWNSYSLDHATRDELVNKYGPHGQPVNQIEDADFLWRDGDLKKARDPGSLLGQL